MESFMPPFKGIIKDLKGRAACYKADWSNALRSGFRWKFEYRGNSNFHCYLWDNTFNSWWPAFVDSRSCRTHYYNVHSYNFCKGREELDHKLFLAWAAWVCVWTAILVFLLAIFNAGNVIIKFTRVGGKLFGMLITVLFLQDSVKGVVSEFNMPKHEHPLEEKNKFYWLYTNGLLGIIFSFGLLVTALKSRKARSWQYGTGWLRSFIADYGVLLMVLLWSAISYSVPSKLPAEVPKRLHSPLLWDSTSAYHWTVMGDMGKVPVAYICNCTSNYDCRFILF